MSVHDTHTPDLARNPLQARPTVYNGVHMRSRLEATYAAWLDKAGFDWTYEPECFATEDGQYLPDFLLRSVPFLHDTRDVYVDVKPTAGAGVTLARSRKMSVIWASKPDAVLAIEMQPDGKADIMPVLCTSNPYDGDVMWLLAAWIKPDPSAKTHTLAHLTGLNRLRYAP